MSAALDDAAAAALFSLRKAPYEHIGAIYTAGDNYGRTETVTTEQDAHTRGAIEKPAGSRWAALFHNHPDRPQSSSSSGLKLPDGQRDRFSPSDKKQAEDLHVPSYISAGDKVMRFDPATGKSVEVLAQFPWEEQKRRMMIEILERDPDDPLGLFRQPIAP